jgi:hypothetical protein
MESAMQPRGISSFIRFNLARLLHAVKVECEAIDPLIQTTQAGLELEETEFTQIRQNQRELNYLVKEIETKMTNWNSLILGLSPAAAEAEYAVQATFLHTRHFADLSRAAEEFLRKTRSVVGDLEYQFSLHPSRNGSQRGDNISLAGTVISGGVPPLSAPSVRTTRFATGPATGTRAPSATSRPVPPIPTTTPTTAPAWTMRPMHQMMLPKLQPKKFSGDPARFKAFWQSFTTSVHNQPITDAEKADYLLHMLEGQAKKATDGYLATDEDYPLICDILQTEFGDKDLVSASLHHELYRMAPPKDEPVSLRDYTQQLDRICRQLKQQGLDCEAPNLMLTAKGKLPDRVRLLLLDKEQDQRNSGALKWNMTEFRAALNQHIRVREDSDRCKEAMATPRLVPQHFRWTS